MSAAPTPHAARASQPPTGAATPAVLAPPAPPSIPPPSSFDVLPDLHKLLKRLIEPPTDPAPAQDGPLDIQHVATAASDIRVKIQKARRAVMALPDIDRTCEDQEDEIEDLEAKIARLKASLAELGRPVVEERDGDQSMTG